MAMESAEDRPANRIRRLVEGLWRSTKTTWQVEISVKKKSNPNPRGEKDTNLKSKPKSGARPKNGMTQVMIETGGRSYADLVKDMKGRIDESTFGVDIRNVKQVNGGIQIQLKEKKKGAQGRLVDFINSDLGVKAAARTDAPSQTVVIYRLEETTTKDEIKKGLMAELKCEEDSLKVEEIRVRETNGIKTSSVLVKMSRPNASRIVKIGGCKIGWKYCSVRPWVNPPRCYRCQEMGHKVFECKNQEVTEKKCYRCGEAGHLGRECTKKASGILCAKCEVNGHAAYTSACPAFRIMLRSARQEARGSTTTTQDSTKEQPTPARASSKEAIAAAEASGDWVTMQRGKKTINEDHD